MKIIKPEVSLWIQHDKVAHVARCARVCYGREQGNNNALYDSLEKRNHLSMYRHETYYSAVPIKGKDDLIYSALNGYLYNPYIKYITYKDYCYIITNGNFLRDIQKINPFLYNSIYNYQITPEEAEQIEPIWKHFMRYTFCVTTQISTSRELNRVSPNNISEQSTRYVDFNKKLGIQIATPHWFYGLTACKRMLAKLMFKTTEWNYKLAKKVLGLKPQDAREFLCLGTNSVVVYTYSLKEWMHILDLRYFGTTGIPHPNAYNVASAIKKIFKEHYDIDINEKGFESNRIK